MSLANPPGMRDVWGERSPGSLNVTVNRSSGPKLIWKVKSRQGGPYELNKIEIENVVGIIMEGW